MAAFRVVLRYRERDAAFVTHKQFLYENGSCGFGDGNYFTWPPNTMRLPGMAPFERAYADWTRRCQEAKDHNILAPIERWAVIHEDEL